MTASLRRNGATIEWDAVVEMERPVKTVTTIVRGVPRGHVSFGGGGFNDPHDNELLAGYTFGAGDLNGPGGSMTTPLLMIQTASDVFYVSSLDDHMRPKRFYLAPGDTSYRVEAIYEHDGWREDKRVSVPTWRLGRVANEQDAIALHMQHIEKAFGLKSWETRTDVPEWMRNLAMVTTLHGMHYTGYMFNDYAKQLEILRWMATQIPGDRVLVFLSAWDGRYYWDYPTYKVSDRMGGEAGFRRLIDEGHKLGFKMMPMYGTNCREHEASKLARDRQRSHEEDRRQRLQPRLGGLEQRPPRGRLARLHESWRRRVARTPRRTDRRHDRRSTTSMRISSTSSADT